MIEQRTPEWFEARKGRVTGSIAAAILGIAPYMTRADAMRAMVRASLGAETEFKGNVATEYGTRNEPGALLEYQMENGCTVKPASFVTCDDWLGASPDGFVDEGDGLVEIKCPYGLRNAEAPVPFKSINEQPHYYVQMQVQMIVTGTAWCDFFQWAPNGTKLETVWLDQGWLKLSLPRLRQFHAEFLDELASNPTEHLEPRRLVIDTPEAARMVAEWEAIKEQLEQLGERKTDLLGSMVALAGGKNALLAGTHKLTSTDKAGSISYAKAIKELLPDADLEKWRGKHSKFWAVR